MTWYITGNPNVDQTKFLGTTNNQPLIIKTNQAADNTEKVRINPDGNVGIAKAPSATYKLDVAGTINATDILKDGAPLSMSQWADLPGGIGYTAGNVDVGGDLKVAGQLRWGNSVANPDSIELGAPDGGTPGGGGTPFIDFHFMDRTEDYNARIINDQDGRLSVVGNLNVSGAINATDVLKNGSSLLNSQWSGVSGGIRYAGNVSVDGQLSVARPWADWVFLQQQRNAESGGGFHVHNPWGDSTAPQGSADRNRLEIAYRTASGQDLWGQFVLHGPTGNVGVGTATPRAKLDVSGSGGAYQCCAPVTPTLSLSEASNTANGQAWLQFHNWGEAEAYIRLAGGGPAGSGREGLRRIEIGDSQGASTALQLLANSNPIRFSAGWTAFPDAVTNQAEISNDTGTYKTLMIVGNRSAGVGRRVSVWDRFEVNGSAFKPGGGSWSSISDARVKKNVAPLKGALEKLLRLRGVSFEWKNPQEQGNLEGEQMGLIAQEVEEVLPQWISTDPDGYKNMTVRGFEALAIEAFKQLKAEFKAENDKLRSAVGELRARIEDLKPA